MPKARVLAGAIVAGAVAVTSMLAAAPAGAATLPSGQKITVIDYYDGWATFYDASPSDASLTPVSDGDSQSATDFTGVDVDDDGHGYAIANTVGEGSYSTLYDADAGAGTLSNPRMIMLDFLDVQVEAETCSSIDYTAGVLMAICFDTIEETPVAFWGVIDPDAAVGEAWLTPLYEFSGQAFLNFTAMAIDPISGLVYAIANLEGYALFVLSQDEGAEFVTWIDGPVWGFDFDRGGQAWVTTDEEIWEGEFPTYYSALATLDLEDGSMPFHAAMTVDGDMLGDPLVQPITVWGKEILPATGASNTLLIGGAAAVVLLVGAILAAGALAGRRGEIRA